MTTIVGSWDKLSDVTTTNETVTGAQIRALRAEAKLAGDDVMADICDVALAAEDSDGTGTVLGRPLSVEAARAEVVRVIRSNEAQ